MNLEIFSNLNHSMILSCRKTIHVNSCGPNDAYPRNSPLDFYYADILHFMPAFLACAGDLLTLHEFTPSVSGVKLWNTYINLSWLCTCWKFWCSYLGILDFSAGGLEVLIALNMMSWKLQTSVILPCTVEVWSSGEGTMTFLTRGIFKKTPRPKVAQALSGAEWLALFVKQPEQQSCICHPGQCGSKTSETGSFQSPGELLYATRSTGERASWLHGRGTISSSQEQGFTTWPTGKGLEKGTNKGNDPKLTN